MSDGQEPVKGVKTLLTKKARARKPSVALNKSTRSVNTGRRGSSLTKTFSPAASSEPKQSTPQSAAEVSPDLPKIPDSSWVKPSGLSTEAEAVVSPGPEKKSSIEGGTNAKGLSLQDKTTALDSFSQEAFPAVKARSRPVSLNQKKLSVMPLSLLLSPLSNLNKLPEMQESLEKKLIEIKHQPEGVTGAVESSIGQRDPLVNREKSAEESMLSQVLDWITIEDSRS